MDEAWLAARIPVYSYCTAVAVSLSLILPAREPTRSLDSPSMLGIRGASPVAWDRNSVRELCRKRRDVLGDGGDGSILAASPFSLYECDWGTCCRLQRQQYELAVRVVSVSFTSVRKNETLVFTYGRAAHKILHSYKEVQK